MAKTKRTAHCGRCQRETSHKCSRHYRRHCSICGTECVGLIRGAKGNGGLPSSFLLEKHPDGQLGLYVALSVGRKGQGEEKVMYYLKDVLPSSTRRKEIEAKAWGLFMTLEEAI